MSEHVRKACRRGSSRAVHPGAGRRKGLMHPKGRVLQPRRSARLAAILGDASPSDRC